MCVWLTQYSLKEYSPCLDLNLKWLSVQVIFNTNCELFIVDLVQSNESGIYVSIQKFSTTVFYGFSVISIFMLKNCKQAVANLFKHLKETWKGFFALVLACFNFFLLTALSILCPSKQNETYSYTNNLAQNHLSLISAKQYRIYRSHRAPE